MQGVPLEDQIVTTLIQNMTDTHQDEEAIGGVVLETSRFWINIKNVCKFVWSLRFI